ncbi:MAG: DUF2953 domain-containing protein [Clostridia bacterium]|nr:DUF2953 domain-containing protein [Clostridia bacterium]
MNYYLLIPIAVILLFFLPIKLEGRASFNAFDMTGAIGVFLYGKKIEHERFRISKGKVFALIDDQGQEKEFDKDKMIFTKMLIGEIKDKTRLQELFVMYNFGLNDAFLTAMAAGYLNTIFYIIFSSIKNYKPTASLGVCENIAYNKEVCVFSVTLKISISLFDVVYSLIHSLILTRKQAKLEKINKGETV